MARIKYVNSKLKQKNRTKRTKTSRKNKWNGLLSRKTPQNIKENIRHLQAKNHPVKTRITK